MRTLLTIALLLTLTSALSAQDDRPRGDNGTFIAVEVNGKVGPAVEIATSQNVVNGKIVHDVTATLLANAPTEVAAILTEALTNGGMLPAHMTMTLTYVTAGVVTEVRIYSNVTVHAIDVTGFDATSDNDVRWVFRMKARSLKAGVAGGQFSRPVPRAIRRASQGAYALTLGNLPSQHIDKIAATHLIPSFQTISDSLIPFEIWVRDIDAVAWRTWFEQSIANPALSKSGRLKILDRNLAEVIATIIIGEARPISYSDVTTASGTKALVGLRVNRAQVVWEP